MIASVFVFVEDSCLENCFKILYCNEIFFKQQQQQQQKSALSVGLLYVLRKVIACLI